MIKFEGASDTLEIAKEYRVLEIRSRSIDLYVMLMSTESNTLRATNSAVAWSVEGQIARLLPF